MASPAKSGGNGANEGLSEQKGSERAPVRGKDAESDITSYLTLSSSEVPIRGRSKSEKKDTEPMQRKAMKPEPEVVKEPVFSQGKRSRSKARKERRVQQEPRLPHVKFAPSRKNIRFPVPADHSDDEDDSDSDEDRPKSRSRQRRSRSNSKNSNHGVVIPMGEQIFQEELARAEGSFQNENHRQRRQRLRAQKKSAKHYVRTPSESESDNSDDDSNVVPEIAESFASTSIPPSPSRDGRERSRSPGRKEHYKQPKPNNRRKEGLYLPKTSPESSDGSPASLSPSTTPVPVQSESKPSFAPHKASEPVAIPRAEAKSEKDKLSTSVPTVSSSVGSYNSQNSQDSSLLSVPVPRYHPAQKTLDDILLEEEGLKGSGGIDDTGDVEKTRSYTEDTKVKVEEDAEHEFKAVQNTAQPLERIVAYCRKYIVSFLNANGGIMYFGVEDDGKVKGVPFSRRGRDLLRLGIDMTVSSIKPQVDTDLVRVLLIPVEPASNHARKRLQQQQQGDEDRASRYVVEIHIARGDAPVYLTHDGMAYFRRSGSVYRMDQELIQRRMENGRPKMGGGALSSLPREFIGRENELERIKEYILQHQNSRYLLVFLHGLPMAGKTTLARQLVDTWASMWADGQYVADLKGFTSNYIEPIEAQVRIIRSVYPILQLPASKAEVTSIYESCFTAKRAILLLENVGRVEQIQSMVGPATNSAKSVLAIVTSRRDLPIEVEMEGISLKLNALEEKAAVELLRQIVSGRGPTISDPTAKELVKLCGYMPLPIRMLAANVARMPNESSLTALIKEVQSDDSRRIELLFGKLAGTLELHIAPSSEQLKEDGEAIQKPPESAAPVDPRPPQEYLLSLSIFPSSFDLLAASYFWGLSVRETGAILQSLVDSNEIDLSQDKLRYSQNDLFKAWCQKKALEVFEESGILKWKHVFLDYYLNVMAKCVEFYQNRQVNQGLELLLLESANFERAITYSLQICDAEHEYRPCATLVVTLDKLNGFFGSGEQRKWSKLRVQLVAKPQVSELVEAIVSGKDINVINTPAHIEEATKDTPSQASTDAPKSLEAKTAEGTKTIATPSEKPEAIKEDATKREGAVQKPVEAQTVEDKIESKPTPAPEAQPAEKPTANKEELTEQAQTGASATK